MNKAETDQNRLNHMEFELNNLSKISERLKPCSGGLPKLNNIDIYGETIPFNKIAGGDHIVYVDFNKRYDLDYRIQVAKKKEQDQVVENLVKNKTRAGILLADAAGHNTTDVLLTAMLHQAFLTGIYYELKQYGEITNELFEILNTRFFRSSSLSKFITLLYGEIDELGRFRFLSAGHPLPIVFSNERNTLHRIQKSSITHFPPIGTLPSREDIDRTKARSRFGYKKKYQANEIELMGQGDIMILYTDGFVDFYNDIEHPYIEERLEKKLAEIKEKPAKEIFQLIKEDMFEFASPGDDLSFVIVKRMIT